MHRHIFRELQLWIFKGLGESASLTELLILTGTTESLNTVCVQEKSYFSSCVEGFGKFTVFASVWVWRTALDV